MKKLIFALLLFSIILGCKEEPKTSYVINGTAEGVYNGIRIYLNKKDDIGRMIAVDTAIVMNEKFSFEGKLKHPKLFYVTVNGIPGNYPIILENTNTNLSIDKKYLSKSKFEGAKSHLIFKGYQEQMNVFFENYKETKKDLSQSMIMNDTTNIKQLNKKLDEVINKIDMFQFRYIEENKNSYGVLPLLTNVTNSKNIDYEKVIKLYNSLDDNIKNSEEGILIKFNLNNIKKKIEVERKTAIGAIAPEFSAPTPSGEKLALKEVISKGKITMIDFWAAWCGPCRRENPNIVKVYEKYHEKGLEIIGVGLDGRRGQQSPKDAWVKAIKDDNLTWHQVSNLRYFDEIAKLYNINSIPSSFILDAEGKIIAKNLRGIALERKMAELLD